MNYEVLETQKCVKIDLGKWVISGFRIYHREAGKDVKFIEHNVNYYRLGRTQIKGIDCTVILAIYKTHDVFIKDIESNDFMIDVEVKMKTSIFNSKTKKNEVFGINKNKTSIYPLHSEDLCEFLGEAHLIINNLEIKKIKLLFIIDKNQSNGMSTMGAVTYLAALNDNLARVNISLKYTVSEVFSEL